MKILDYIWAFIIGGALCVIAQILIDKTKITPARILVLYVCSGVVLTALGIYAPIVEFAGCGATVPLTGFGYAIAQGVQKAVDEQGLLVYLPEKDILCRCTSQNKNGKARFC